MSPFYLILKKELDTGRYYFREIRIDRTLNINFFIKKIKMQSPKIVSVEALAKYKLKIQFTDGTQGIYEISDLAGQGVFKIWDIDNIF